MIAQSFAIVAPIFCLIALGYLAARFKLVSAQAGSGLSEFVFVIAIPALLFRTVASAAMPPVDPTGYWLSYFGALGIVWAIAQTIARKLGRDPAEAAVIGFAAAQSNTVMIGIPLIMRLYGDAATIPVILLLVVHLPITMTVVTLLIAGRNRDSAASNLRMLFTHPILIGIFAGILYQQSGFAIPDLAGSFLKFLGDAAAPCALVATGMAMSKVSLRGSGRLIMLLSVLKLLVLPALVFSAAHYLFRLPPVWVNVAVVFAACPTGINAYLVAERYRTGQAVASGATALSALLGIITLTAVIALLSLMT